MTKKETETIKRLVKKISAINPSGINYSPETTQGGTRHQYVVVQGDFRVTLEGWCGWDSNRLKDNPSGYRILVSYAGKPIFNYEISQNIQPLNRDLQLERGIASLYKKLCHSVDRHQEQEEKNSKKQALKKLEEMLKQ